MKVQDRQNGPLKSFRAYQKNWLATRLAAISNILLILYLIFVCKGPGRRISIFTCSDFSRYFEIFINYLDILEGVSNGPIQKSAQKT